MPMNTDTISPASAFHDAPINILIVDDEPTNLAVLETILDDPGYRLVRAESADQALLALVAGEFALLILDIRLPGMTGFELAQMIKERKKTAQIPIIFLSAYYREDEHVLEGYGAGAVDYLHKPVNPAILRSKVAVFAELHRKSRDAARANRALLAEVAERRRAEERLRELNETLEQRVTDRTNALLTASAALTETGERYRSLFEGSLDAIFSLGADGRFAAANPAALRLTGHTIEDLKTVHFLELCPPEQRPAAEHAFRAAFCRQCLTMETTAITATGERRELFISGAPAIVDGEVIGVSCIARDVTERKRAEERLQDSLHEKEVLLREVHHRVKNNLQIVSSLLNLQSRQLTDPAAVDVFASTRDRVRAMAAVHERLYESGDFGAIDLAAHLEKLARMLLRAHAMAVQPVLRLDPVMVDLSTAVPLSLIASELLTNALKYAFAGDRQGTLTLGLRAEGAHHELRIADDGPGLPAALDPAATRTLGLRLVRDLARQIRGELAIASTAAGTSVTVRWPARLSTQSRGDAERAEILQPENGLAK